MCSGHDFSYYDSMCSGHHFSYHDSMCSGHDFSCHDSTVVKTLAQRFRTAKGDISIHQLDGDVQYHLTKALVSVDGRHLKK